ncbi:MAG TPA: hypothetical protein VFQ79_09190 [Bryobacteraceae bacterium]|nr:hypothetical protein [Bryobacteraceae bacterium]
MTDQFIIAIAVAPVLSLVIVVAGYIVQNSNLNARMAEFAIRVGDTRSELRSALEQDRSALRELLRAELSAVRAEMARNQSELLSKFAELDHRLSTLESRFRIERP